MEINVPRFEEPAGSQQAIRRLNRNVDHSERNKRRVPALVATLAVAAAFAAIALALAPVFLD